KPLLEQLELDKKNKRTLLAVVAPDGTMIADPGLTREMADAARHDGATTTVTANGQEFMVQSVAMNGVEGQGEIARVIMARKLDGVLQLFPGARLVFALATIGMLLIAVATALRARAISGARIA